MENVCNVKLVVIGPVIQKIFLNVKKLNFKWQTKKFIIMAAKFKDVVIMMMETAFRAIKIIIWLIKVT
jgi:hypothetical protein